MAETQAKEAVQAYANDTLTTDLEPLSEFVPRFVEPAFWAALVDSASDMFPAPPARLPALSLVVAEDPLLGLAAAAVYSLPEIHIPIVGGRQRRLRRIDRLSDAVSMHHELRSFVRECRGLPRRETASLMLAWDARDPLGRRDAIAAELASVPSLNGGVVCLCDRRKNATPMAGDPDVLLDVSDAIGLVAGALWRLALPDLDLADQDEAERWLDRLLQEPDLTLERVISGLSTPSHGDFLRHAQRLRTNALPEVADGFKRYVMSPTEDRPRHAASLFLVSHFSHLSPRQFIELGDALVMHTPKGRPARAEAAAPGLLTDQVLADCNIMFAPSTRGEMSAMLASAGGGHDDAKGGGGPGRAEQLRWLFERRAPLLRERYLRFLANSLTLGHASWPIARDFIRHEAKALRSAAGNEDAHTLEERLRRAVYGDAPAAAGDTPGEAAGWQEAARRVEVFDRALDRVPALLDELAGSSSDDRLLESVRTLCSPDPTRSGFVPEDVQRLGSAWLFWLLYVHYVGRVRLRDFPGLFQSDPGAQKGRSACVRALFDILHPLEQGRDRRHLDNFDRPDLLVWLLNDIAQEAPRIANDTAEIARDTLLTETWMHYLRRTVRGTRWVDVADWESLMRPLAQLQGNSAPTDLAMARLLLAGDRPFSADWIRQARLRGHDGAAGKSSAASDANENGRALFDLGQLIIDAVVGSAAFGDLDILAIDIWLFAAMRQRGSDISAYSFGYAPFWWRYVGHPTSLDEEVGAAFEEAVDPVFDMFPVVAMMAATHAPPPAPGGHAFVFSPALRDWLVEIPRHAAKSPAQVLLDRVRACFDFQKVWRQAHEQLRLRGVDWSAAKAAMEDRTAALHGFARMLEPLAGASRPRALATAPPAGADPAAGSASAAPATPMAPAAPSSAAPAVAAAGAAAGPAVAAPKG
ncbi:hypothetical protein [Aquabacterium humicola]|uniref:hypothetical protein n=1 Tax=Aquabacterium humicola TaxID=3237377 RepID=UPI002543EE7D|nr:hypothetical protein [Rubrivivax pictus]